MAYGRTDRVAALMHKYRSGNLIEPFKKDEQLLVRSCAKAAIRVLSGITLLRGADYHSSPYRTAEAIEVFAPEAVPLACEAIERLDSPTPPAETAMTIADKSVELFRSLFRSEARV